MTEKPIRPFTYTVQWGRGGVFDHMVQGVGLSDYEQVCKALDERDADIAAWTASHGVLAGMRNAVLAIHRPSPKYPEECNECSDLRPCPSMRALGVEEL